MGGLRALPARLCSPLSLRAPLSRIVCSGAVPGPQPNFEGALIPGLGGAAARRRRGCPVVCPLTPRGLDPQTRGFPRSAPPGSGSFGCSVDPSHPTESAN